MQQGQVNTVFSMVKEYAQNNHETADATVIKATPPYYVVTVDFVPYPIPRIESINPDMLFQEGDRVTLLLPRANRDKIEIVGFATSDIPAEEDTVIIRAAASSVQIYAGRSGAFSITFSGLDGEDLNFFVISHSNPQGLCNDGTYLYVVDTGATHKVWKYNISGELQTSFATYGGGNGQLNNPRGIACDGNYLYICDYGNNRIMKFNLNGGYIAKWGSYGSGNGQFKGPFGITIKANGNILVVDKSNYRVQEFTPGGDYVSQFAISGSSYDIKEDSSGNIYISTSSGQIRKYIAGIYNSVFWSSGHSTYIFYFDIYSDYFYATDNFGEIHKISNLGVTETSWMVTGLRGITIL